MVAADKDEGTEEGPRLIVCAPSLQSFIYRWWIEPELWDALDGHRPLYPHEATYVAGFKPSSVAPE